MAQLRNIKILSQLSPPLEDRFFSSSGGALSFRTGGNLPYIDRPSVGQRSNKTFIVYAKDLSIAWSDNTDYWVWKQVKEPPNDTPIKVVELLGVAWLDARGKFNTKLLSPNTLYKVAFMVKLNNNSREGRQQLVKFELVQPNGTKKVKEKDIRTFKKNKWIEVSAGSFETSPENIGEIAFSMYEHDNSTRADYQRS